MKKILSVYIILLTFVSSVAHAQSNVSFTSEQEARQMISLITDVVGLKSNFKIKAGDVDNAAAVIYSGQRYVLYNPVFIRQVKNAVKTDWAGISILAHEVGHHLNGHTLLRSGSTPAIELEADEFSGFVLRKMGASLSESQAVMRLISNERGSKTHPQRSKRLASIEKGWTKADVQVASIAKPEIRQPATVESIEENNSTTSVTYNFPQKYILREVHLFALPGEALVITTGNNFVRLTSDGYQLLGSVVRINGGTYLKLGQKNYIQITAQGHLLNASNKKVGYLKSVSAKLFHS
jgi:hypothetical protein